MQNIYELSSAEVATVSGGLMDTMEGWSEMMGAIGGGMVGGALDGALIGLSGGPVGAIIGGAAGAFIGGLSYNYAMSQIPN